MSGFIMTLDSDDEAPRSPSPNPQPLASTSSAAAEQSRKSNAKAKQSKLTKKQRQKAAKVAIQDDDADSDSKRGGAGSRQDQDDAAMAAGFVFDGLGGGFVGRDRHSVWVRRFRFFSSSPHSPWLTPPILGTLQDSGEAYIQNRPNAMVGSSILCILSCHYAEL